MAYFSPKTTQPSNCLYIFYDCEATGDVVSSDHIIELAAVVSPRADLQFQSLCYTDKDISPMASELTGLTNRDLIEEPHLPEVLQRLFDWVSERVDQATREKGVQCTPVLVAHGGFSLDYPMLMAEVERLGGGYKTVSSNAIYQKIKTLNLHFGDSYTTCKSLATKKDQCMEGIEKLGQEKLYQAFFHEEYSSHRALPDAQALHRLFTESPLKNHLSELIMKSPQEAYDHWKAIQLTPAGIVFGKAKGLVRRGVYLEHMQQQYKHSPHTFQGYLRTLGISRPSQELKAYFEIRNTHSTL